MIHGFQFINSTPLANIEAKASQSECLVSKVINWGSNGGQLGVTSYSKQYVLRGCQAILNGMIQIDLE